MTLPNFLNVLETNGYKIEVDSHGNQKFIYASIVSTEEEIAEAKKVDELQFEIDGAFQEIEMGRENKVS